MFRGTHSDDVTISSYERSQTQINSLALPSLLRREPGSSEPRM